VAKLLAQQLADVARHAHIAFSGADAGKARRFLVQTDGQVLHGRKIHGFRVFDHSPPVIDSGPAVSRKRLLPSYLETAAARRRKRPVGRLRISTHRSQRNAEEYGTGMGSPDATPFVLCVPTCCGRTEKSEVQRPQKKRVERDRGIACAVPLFFSDGGTVCGYCRLTAAPDAFNTRDTKVREGSTKDTSSFTPDRKPAYPDT